MNSSVRREDNSENFETNEMSVNGAGFRISTCKEYVGLIEIFPFPDTYFRNITKGENGRPIIELRGEYHNDKYRIGFVDFDPDEASSVSIEMSTCSPCRYNSDDSVSEVSDDDEYERVDVELADCMVSKDDDCGISEYEFEYFRIEKTDLGYAIMRNSDDQKEILVLSEMNAGCSLQDGDCANYVHYFKGYGIVLFRNCGDVSSCVLVYVRELDLLCNNGQNIKGADE